MDASAALLIGTLFERSARARPESAAASLGGAVLSHAELDRAAERTAGALRARGARHGTRVVGWADTRLEVLPLFAALAKLGAVYAPLDGRLSVEEALAVAAVARPELLVTDAAHAEAGAPLARGLGVAQAPLGSLGEPQARDTLLGAPAPASPIVEPALRETDPHVLFFTSGSTGRPKAVVLSHRASWLRSFQGVFRDEPERTVCMFPLFHMAAFTLALAAWQTRGEIAFVNATAEAILDAVEARRANRLYCIPSVWQRILASDTRARDLSSLRWIDTGTSATPIELLRELVARFPGAAVRVFYGSTEVGSASMLGHSDVLRKPGSVGLPPPGVDLRIGESGEIQVRSPYLCDGYFGDAEASRAALRDGWFHTGDLGELDDEGHLRVVGRLKEVIRTGGESVAPGEVEAVLARDPAVAEVAVVGIPDAQWGEIVCAVVVPATGASPTLADLQKRCEGVLAGFKKPRRLELVAALPRTPATRQVQRALLVQQIVSLAGRRA
jgi:acyl-CoA synthetase (AMP-forming)/AMP-acid ligase II